MPQKPDIKHVDLCESNMHSGRLVVLNLNGKIDFSECAQFIIFIFI